jgi:N-acylneuraminate cytidylyltransferase
MKLTAVIPVRKGSQRLKDKNLRPFANTSLLEIKIKMLLQVPELDSIVINTNSDAAIELVETKYGGTKVSYHRREEYYASSQCSGSDFFKHLGEVTDTDIFIYTPCTSPFVKPETLSECINKFLSSKEYDCVSTVSLVKEFLWLEGKAINYDPLNAPNSQNLPDVVALNFGTTVVAREDLIKNHNIIGKHPNFVKTSDIEAIDIDTPLDFYIAEQIYIKTVLENKELLDR